MNLALFMLGGCREKVEEPLFCKEELKRDAMPLIRIPGMYDRIPTYGQFLEGQQQLSMVQLSRNDSFGSRLEHQYILDLNSITDEDQVLEFRKVFALTSCKLHYHNKQSLEDLNWDIDTLFGAGRPDLEVGAFELRPLYNEGLEMSWNRYYPGNPDFDFRMFYFNLDLTKMYDYIFSLVERCITWDYAKIVLDIESFEPKLGWETDYYDWFINNSTASIQINGGDVLGEAHVDVLGINDKNFRLSVFYLEKDSNIDFSPRLEMFMQFRGRVPVEEEREELIIQRSMSGHPILNQYTNRAVEASRIDLVNQNSFEFKNKNVLALDPDLTPSTLIYKRLPTVEQQQVLLSMGVLQAEWEKNEFILYNPDERIIDITVEADVQNAGIQIVPSNIAGTIETNVQISVPSNVTSARIRIFNYATGTEPIQELDLVFFDCVIVPVRFWKLKLNHVVEESWYGTIGESKSTIAPDTGTGAAINYANKLLSNQCNTYLRWIDLGSPLNTIEVTTQSLSHERAEVEKGRFKLDLHNLDHHREIQAFLNGLGPTVEELNIIWTWEMLNPDFGNTPTYEFTFPYPYILASSVNNQKDDKGNIYLSHTDDDRGRVLAHEFGHYITQRNRSILSTQEVNHFDHLKDADGKYTAFGHYQYAFNLMAPTTTEENEQLTTEQARIINQYSQNISGSIPHTN